MMVLPKLAPLAAEFDKAVGANADILASDISIGLNAILRVTVSLSGASTFILKLTRGTTEKTLLFNAGANLVANALYMFDIEVRVGDKVNFQPGSAVTVHILNVSEIISMGP